MCSKLHNKQKHFQSLLFSIAGSRSNGENESYQLLLLIKILLHNSARPLHVTKSSLQFFGENIFNRARFNELFNQHLNESVFRSGFNLRILLRRVFVKHFLI